MQINSHDKQPDDEQVSNNYVNSTEKIMVCKSSLEHTKRFEKKRQWIYCRVPCLRVSVVECFFYSSILFHLCFCSRHLWATIAQSSKCQHTKQLDVVEINWFALCAICDVTSFSSFHFHFRCLFCISCVKHLIGTTHMSGARQHISKIFRIQEEERPKTSSIDSRSSSSSAPIIVATTTAAAAAARI